MKQGEAQNTAAQKQLAIDNIAAQFDTSGQFSITAAGALAGQQTANPEKLIDLLQELASSSAKNHAVKDTRIAALETQLTELLDANTLSLKQQALDSALLRVLTAGEDITELQQLFSAVLAQEVVLYDLTARHTVGAHALDAAAAQLLTQAHKQQNPVSGTDSSYRSLVIAAAKRSAELVGAVVIYGQGSEANMKLAARCGEILAAFVVAQRRLRGDLTQRRHELLELLVDPPAGGLPPATLRRLAAHGIAQDSPFRIVVGVGPLRALEALEHRLEFDFGSQLLRGIIGSELIMIINEENFSELRQSLKGQLRRSWQGTVMGHSPRLHRIEIVPPELAVIRRVVSAAKHSGRADSPVLVSLESYGVLGAFLSRVNIEPTKAAMRETLAPLLEYDAKHGTELVATAFNFFNEGRSIAAVAHLMHVHENTVRQRLDRIAGLLGSEWSYGQAGLDYHIMLSLLRLLQDD